MSKFLPENLQFSVVTFLIYLHVFVIQKQGLIGVLKLGMSNPSLQFAPNVKPKFLGKIRKNISKYLFKFYPACQVVRKVLTPVETLSAST